MSAAPEQKAARAALLRARKKLRDAIYAGVTTATALGKPLVGDFWLPAWLWRVC